MKKGWTYKKLGEVCEILNGFAFKSSNYVPEGVRVIRITNVQKGYVEDNDPKYYPYETKDELSRYLLKEGDMLLSLTGNVGRVAILGKSFLPAYLNQRVACIRVRKGVELDLSFLFHLLYSQKFEDDCIKSSNGAAQLNMSTVWLASYLIPVPPLSEQQSIVDYLDSAFAKIDAMKANAQKALNEAQALFQASLKEMLEPKEGWEEKKLSDIGELKNGMNFNKNESGYNVHILGVGDFGNLFQIKDTDSLQTISLNSKPSEEYILKNEDIVFVRSNGNKNLVGRCVLIYVGNEHCSFSGFCIRLRKTTNEIDACYLTHFLKTEDARKKLVGNGANISNLNQKVLNEFVVSYPPLTEQQSIVATLDSLKSKVDQLQENYDKISQECDALKQAILRQVFE